MATTRTRITKAAALQPEQAPPPPPGKTAVVVIHGMGEQTPLETLRGFVETVYQRDLTLSSRPVGTSGVLDVSIVPDAATGSGELRRITTLGDGPQKRTDFFEFYWADIMDGTPLDMVRGWIRTLLLRSPFRLPDSWKVRWAWAILWVLAAFVLFAGFIAVHPEPESLDVGKVLLDLGTHVGPWRPYLAGALAALGLIVLAVRLVWSLPEWRQVALGWPMILLAAAVVLQLIPGTMADSLRFWAVALTAGVSLGMNALVAPYAGDVARYVRATPGTVGRRQLVRERGMALLEALHNKGRDDPTREGAGDLPAYDRIVIVGHSLGTIIAYDILQLFWEKHGPTHHQRWVHDAGDVQDAFKACDVHVKTAWDKDQPSLDAAGFEAARANLSAVLAARNPGWRISDFITLGSALTHAEFLLVDSAKDVENATAERRFATAPPHPDPQRQGSMLFSLSQPAPVSRPSKAARKAADPPLFAHFAAQFAAVKWTNIYDECSNPLLGDLVSGSLRKAFGPGINEYNVAIRRPWWWGWLGRVFTHTQYWQWHQSFEPSPENLAAGEDLKMRQAERASQSIPEQQVALQQLLWHNVPEHIRQLRLALRLES